MSNKGRDAQQPTAGRRYWASAEHDVRMTVDYDRMRKRAERIVALIAYLDGEAPDADVETRDIAQWVNNRAGTLVHTGFEPEQADALALIDAIVRIIND